MKMYRIKNSNYYLTNDFRIYNEFKNKFLIPTIYNTNRIMYKLYLKNGETKKRIHSISLARIVYSVEKGICVTEIPSNFTIRFIDDKPGFGNFIIRDYSDFMKEIRYYSLSIRLNDNEYFYERCKEFINLAAKKDSSGMYEMLNVDKNKKSILYALNRKMNPRKADEIFPILVNELILGVVERRLMVFDPVTYIKKWINKKFKEKYYVL